MWLYSTLVAQIETYFVRRYLYPGLEPLRFQNRLASAMALGSDSDYSALCQTLTDASKEDFVGVERQGMKHSGLRPSCLPSPSLPKNALHNLDETVLFNPRIGIM